MRAVSCIFVLLQQLHDLPQLGDGIFIVGTHRALAGDRMKQVVQCVRGHVLFVLGKVVRSLLDNLPNLRSAQHHRHLAHQQVPVAKLLHQKSCLLKQRKVARRSLVVLAAQVHHHRLQQQLPVVGQTLLLEAVEDEPFVGSVLID